jgi:hypothetical protein
MFQLTARSLRRHFDASLTNRTWFPLGLWHAVIVPEARSAGPPEATVTPAPSTPTANRPSAIVRGCTHPPFVGFAVRRIVDALARPVVRSGRCYRKPAWLSRAVESSARTRDPPRGLRALGKNVRAMRNELVTPELALVDPELRARAQAALPDYSAPSSHRQRSAHPAEPGPSPAETRARRATGYPFWARVTAMLWVLVIGILIGGTAVPHAQDGPRVVPPEEDATICERPQQTSPRLKPPAPGAPRG